MDLHTIFVVLIILLVSILHIEARPKLTVRQIIRKNMERIWMDGYETGKKSKKKMKIYERDVSHLVTDEDFSICRAGRLLPGVYCQHLTYENGSFIGTNRELRGNEGIFQIESYGTGIVRIKYVPTGLYLIINEFGRINATNDKSNLETLFYSTLEEITYLETFASAKYYMREENVEGAPNKDLLIGVKVKGDTCKIKNAKNTKSDSRSDQFSFLQESDQSFYCKRDR
ncbi:uncharacterized protein [Clytia hemisphaerica]|uniref:Fibroblast growth factor n=2 Tax=Clytia hemisphaerica TaxID=252671 RepID=A0A7M5VBL4_9CNID